MATREEAAWRRRPGRGVGSADILSDGTDTSHQVFRTEYRWWTLTTSRSRGPDGEWPRPQDGWTTETVRNPKDQVKNS